jgi:copper chaperone CopZ
MKHNYSIEGMHCESCVTKIGQALRGIAGITSAQVGLYPPKATVSMDRHVPVAELQNAVQRAGDYTIRPDGVGAPVKAGDEQRAPDSKKESLYPLLLIVGYLLGTVLLIACVRRDFSLHLLMTRFMGGFFLVFSFFKFLDLRGFAEAYRSYDVLARAIPLWGFVYPFVELALGIAFVAGWNPVATNVVTLVVMLVGAVGVFRALLSKTHIRCACLGTALNLPMTTITLVEDVGMAAMAALMLVRMA